MKKNLLLIAIIAVFLISCFAPVNLTYESAKTLNKGDIELQGNYSRYYYQTMDNSELSNCNYNYGIKIGYGLKDRYTIKMRYERLVLKSDYEIGIFGLSEAFDYLAVNYFEIENKFKFKNANVAIGVPIGYYSYVDEPTGGVFVVDPRVYLTFSTTNKFELNIIPKAHLLIAEDIKLYPGISVGLGFSSDLNKWVVRPEFGYDGCISFGIGVNINLTHMIKDK